MSTFSLHIEIFFLYSLIGVVILSCLYAIAQLPYNLKSNESLYKALVRIVKTRLIKSFSTKKLRAKQEQYAGRRLHGYLKS